MATDKEIDQAREIMEEIDEKPLSKHPFNKALDLLETISKRRKTTE